MLLNIKLVYRIIFTFLSSLFNNFKKPYSDNEPTKIRNFERGLCTQTD